MKDSIACTSRREPGKHHPLTIALHWGTAMCIAVAAIAVLLREVVEDQFWRQVLVEIHRQLGLMVLFGVAVRLGIRLRYGMADHTSRLPRPIRWAANCARWSLYGLLVAMPLLGWATTNAHNLPVRFLGLLVLPALVAADSEFADQLSDRHILGAWALFGLASLHTAAAFYHHLIRRDHVLWAMLPGRTAPDPARVPKTTRGDGELSG